MELLELINRKNLFSITKKDQYTGDNLIHFAIFEEKKDFIHNVLHLYENEITHKNANGNTPFHYACLRGNVEIVLMLFQGKKAKQSKSHYNTHPQPVDLIQKNSAGLFPI